MTQILIQPAITSQDRKTFLTFPWKIYRNDPLWVPPILSEQKKKIDPQQGAFYKRGEAEFFIAWRGKKPVGTICASVDHKANQTNNKKECVFGFFETIEDEQVANALFDHVKVWARARGLNSLYGPFDLDYEDSYGVLVAGRDRPPVLLCGHTPDYYLGYFENYGFKPGRADNIAFALNVQKNDPQIQQLHRMAERVRQKKDFTVRQADLSKWEEETDRVFYLINIALRHLNGHIPWQREALEATLNSFRQIADPEFILFAEADGKTVGFFPGIPNLNEGLIHANGLRCPWDYLKLMWHMRQQPDCLTIKSVLVLPEYWGTGLAFLMFDEMYRRALAKGYKWIDMSLTSSDNPKTPMLAARMGAEVYKRYRVFRMSF